VLQACVRDTDMGLLRPNRRIIRPLDRPPAGVRDPHAGDINGLPSCRRHCLRERSGKTAADEGG
jgi:hypothetical protein